MNLWLKLIVYILYFITLYISIFILASFILEKMRIEKENKKKRELKTFPDVTIIVPAWNEQESIKKTIRSIYKLNYPKNKFKIITINDASQDNTLKYMREVVKEAKGHNIQIVNNTKNKGKANSVNSVLKHIKTKYIACLDGDSLIDENALYESVAFFEAYPDTAVVTPVMTVYKPQTMLQTMQKIEYQTSMFVVRLLSYIDCNYVAPGPFSMYKTDIFKELGGLSNDTITEDQDFAYNVQNHHLKLRQSPTTKVYTFSPKTIRSLYNQRNRWFKGSLQCIRKYKHVIFNKEYGDFGIFQLPFNIILFTMGVFSIGFFVYYILKPIIDIIRKLHQIGYDITPYLTNMKFTFDILALNWDSIIMSVILLGTALLVLYITHHEQGHKIRAYNPLLFIPYFVFYYLFLSFIATMAIYELFIRRKIQRW